MKNKFLRKFFIYIYIFFSIFTQPIIAASIVVDQNKNQQLHLDKTANGKQMVNINAVSYTHLFQVELKQKRFPNQHVLYVP